MPSRIENYALIGDTETAALVGRDGSIDWACFPRFDSGACFAALLGERGNGRWRVAPEAPAVRIERRYRDGTLILETDVETDTGSVRFIDFMPLRDQRPDIIRIVEGITGEVSINVELIVRFDTGRIVPWVRRRDDALTMTAGPDDLCVRGDVDFQGRDLASMATFSIRAGERRSMVLSWFSSHEPPPPPVDAQRSLRETEAWWRDWSGRCKYQGPWRNEVSSSLRVLKALTFQPTGGIVAAPTTSLPEWPGSVRNWDYRYCWLRDATLTLYALMLGGYVAEAEAWREWLLRAVAGDPDRIQIMYGVGGERRLPEYEADWLRGFEGSRPVRIGNAAHKQLQLDVFGAVTETLYQARRLGIKPDEWSWPLQIKLATSLEKLWSEPDEGLWEIRGPRRHFTHSKVMAWVAFDRMIKSVEQFGLKGPVDHWRTIRTQIHTEVCARAFDAVRGTFTQSYGASALDAALLVIPLVGFLPVGDPRVVGTVAAVERELLQDGLVRRYNTDEHAAQDGLPPGEGLFLPCSFWLADVYVRQGRRAEALALFERLLALRNDVGLLSEEYDPVAKRALGNFPQAFTHLSLVYTAFNLSEDTIQPVHDRPDGNAL